MKKEYILPQIEVVESRLDSEILTMSEWDHMDAKEQNFETDDRLFNTDTKNIWDTEEEEE